MLCEMVHTAVQTPANDYELMMAHQFVCTLPLTAHIRKNYYGKLI